jgi:uncharacterized membrane protein
MRRFIFLCGVNLLLMKMRKFEATKSLGIKMLFRLGSLLFFALIILNFRKEIP